MNSSINYAGFVDMFIDSEEDFEPYGAQSETAVELIEPTSGEAQTQHTLSRPLFNN